MRTPSITKYGFRIRTRMGLIVDNLMIHAEDEPDAQRKLLQMYHGCEVLDCVCHEGAACAQNLSYENVLERLVQ